MTTTRLLLPFTGTIYPLALGYAIQLAEQHQATLVPLALIRVKEGKHARLEDIQQAQDFLELVRCKAERQQVPVELARIYTSDVARSIEAVAGEMNCEAVILFLNNTDDVLLEPAEIRALMDRAACNAHLVLLPARRERKHPLHFPLFKKRRVHSESVAKPEALLDILACEQAQLAHHITWDERLN